MIDIIVGKAEGKMLGYVGAKKEQDGYVSVEYHMSNVLCHCDILRCLDKRCHTMISNELAIR